MLKRMCLVWLVVASITVLLAGTCLADWETVVNEQFTGSQLDDSVWRILSNTEMGDIVVSGDQLRIEGVGGGWRNKGIMLRQPLDITGKRTRIQISYVMQQYTVVVALLNNFPELGVDPGTYDVQADPYSHPAVPVVHAWTNKVDGPSTVNMGTTHPSDGSVEKVDWFQDVAAPFSVTFTLEPKEGSTYEAVVIVEASGNEQQTVETTIDIGSVDPTELYFYLYTSNDRLFGGPAVIEHVLVEQQSIQ